MGSLRFNHIKLVGFKSFVEPTVFQIEPGLTGVVGPNGCGKSNLLEAIRWVMGANSAKAMRASGMDDVIFSGTKSRPGRNQASVTLSIDNSARVAPPMFNDDEELEITRLITKGSGSKYKVNGTTVRAKDVQLLFADASTGANSPALVRQGQINELISAKPANRRRILEEAAGISGLHSRRHEAELRLRAAENNLDRLEDVLGQIEGQLLSLRRQSRQAARYKRLAGEIREYKTLLWLKRWQHALASLITHAQSLKEAETKVQELTGQVANCTTQVSEIAANLEPHREEQIIAAAVCGRLNAAKDALDKDAQAAQSEIKKLEARLNFLMGDVEREEGIVFDAQNAGKKLSAEFDALKATKDISSAVAKAKQQADIAVQKRADLETIVSELTHKNAEHSAQKASAERECEQLSSQQSRIESDIEAVMQSQTALEKNSVGSKDQNLFTASLSEAAHALQTARANEKAALVQKQEAETNERETRDSLAATQKSLTEAQAEQRALSSIVNSARGEASWTPAIENIIVDQGYEAALAAAFGDDLDAGLDENLPLAWDGAKPPSASLPSGTQPLSKFVKAPSKLGARLSQIGVVKNSDGDTIAKQLCAGQRIVSIEGDLWRWDGFRVSAEMPSTAAVKLENINRLAQISQNIAPLSLAAEGADTAWRAARNQRASADKQANILRQALPNLEQDERAAQSTLSQFETDQARRTEQSLALLGRKTRLENEITDISSRLNRAKARLADTGTNEKLTAELQKTSKKLTDARNHADEISAQYRSLENQAQARQARLQAVEQDIADWQERGHKAKERITSLKGRKSETQMALQAANDSP